MNDRKGQPAQPHKAAVPQQGTQIAKRQAEQASRVVAIVDNEPVNLLAPTEHMQRVSPVLQMRFSMVKVSADPESGDVFKTGTAKRGDKYVDLYSLTKASLMRIASAAGIVWSDQGGLIEDTRRIVKWRAIGELRLPDGTWLRLPQVKEIDLDVVEDELRLDARVKLAKLRRYGGLAEDERAIVEHEWRQVKTSDGSSKSAAFLKDAQAEAEWLEYTIARQMIAWRKTRHARAETGAMLRVVRALMGMKSAYTREQLALPFAVPHFDVSLDTSNPDILKAIEAIGREAVAAAARPQAISAPPPPTAPHDGTRVVRELDAEVVVDDGDEGPAADAAHAVHEEVDLSTGEIRETAAASQVGDADKAALFARVSMAVVRLGVDRAQLLKTCSAVTGRAIADPMELSGDELQQVAELIEAPMTQK